MAKKTNPKKPTVSGPLFTIIDFDNLEYYTNLSKDEVEQVIHDVMENEHPTMCDTDLMSVINQTTGEPLTVETTVEFKLVKDYSQPQFRKTKEPTKAA